MIFVLSVVDCIALVANMRDFLPKAGFGRDSILSKARQPALSDDTTDFSIVQKSENCLAD